MSIIGCGLYQEDIKAKVRHIKVDKLSLVCPSAHHPIIPHKSPQADFNESLNVPLLGFSERHNSTQIESIKHLG